MKVKFEFIVDVEGNPALTDMTDYLKAAVCAYRDCGFSNPHVIGICPALEKFPEYTCALVCVETFEAKHTNSVGGTVVKDTRTFHAGDAYIVSCWRPEGAYVDDFFVFHKDANKFVIE